MCSRMQFTVELRITNCVKQKLPFKKQSPGLKEEQCLPHMDNKSHNAIFAVIGAFETKILEKINYILNTKPLCLIVSLVLNGSKGL